MALPAIYVFSIGLDLAQGTGPIRECVGSADSIDFTVTLSPSYSDCACSITAISPVSLAGSTSLIAIRAELVDEYYLLVVPIMLGGGKRVLPSNVCVKLDLLDERRFANGMVHLRHHTRA
jgi:hypothetical protein